MNTPHPPLKPYILLYRDPQSPPFSKPEAFYCQAEELDHAQDQLENFLPGADCLWSGDVEPGESNRAAFNRVLADYWGAGEAAYRARYWKQRARSAEGQLPTDIQAGARALHAISHINHLDWERLTPSQRWHFELAASEVVAAVNGSRTGRMPRDLRIEIAGDASSPQDADTAALATAGRRRGDDPASARPRAGAKGLEQLKATIAAGLPAGSGRYDTGFRDALESALLGMRGVGLSLQLIGEVVTTVLDAFGNNAPDGEAGASTFDADTPPGWTDTFPAAGCWDAYPLGTRAFASSGGHWERVKDGWKWCTGDTFPRPGGDALTVAIPCRPSEDLETLRACLNIAVGDDPRDWEDADGAAIGSFLVPAVAGDAAAARKALDAYHADIAAALAEQEGEEEAVGHAVT